jgi:cytochrome oxidase Cu insertion factor (SCO1/SenC/PrrC family)
VTTNRWLSLTAVALALFLGAARPLSAEDAPSAAELMDDLMWGRTPVGGPFNLIDHTGRRRADAEFRGKFLLVYFGYSYCPDVCPTDLMALATAMDLLGPVGRDVQPLFITIDPERDTVEHLADYVTAFHPSLIGLTGTPEEIRKLALAYKVYYAKVEAPDGSDYAIDHTGFVYLVGPDGQFVGFFPPNTTAERLANIIRQQLPNKPSG